MATNSDRLNQWRPAIGQNKVLTNQQKATGFNLNQSANYATNGALQRRSVDTMMGFLWERLRTAPIFQGVTFTQDYPQSMADCPRVVWRLTGRTPGIDGHNRKSPFLAETWPAEDSTIIHVWNQPHSVNLAFEVFESTPAAAGLLANNLEWFLATNPHVWSNAGADLLMFASEGPHDLYQKGGSQPLDQRTLHYTAIMTYIFTAQFGVIEEIEVRILGPGVKATTVALTRSEGDSSADLFPVPGPVTLVCIHDLADHFCEDYLCTVDYELVVNPAQYGQQFYVNWQRRGKHPEAGATYYATYLTLDPVDAVDATVLTDTQTLPAPNTPTTPSSRRRFPSSPPVPTILGQEILPNRGGEIQFLTREGPQVAEVVSSLRDALTRAQFQVVTLLEQHPR